MAIVAVAACMGLIAAACGGDDDDGDGAGDRNGGAGRYRSRRARKRPPATEPEATEAPETEETEAPTEETEAEEETGASVDPASIETDIGVDDTTITRRHAGRPVRRVRAAGAARSSRPRRCTGTTSTRTAASPAARSSSSSRTTRYDVADATSRSTRSSSDQVAIISQSTGSPHTAAIAQDLVDDDLIAIPLSWYSGWADPELGENVFETYTTYCIESMNGIEWLQKNRDVQTWRSSPSPASTAATAPRAPSVAAEELGLEIVYDGAGQVTPPSADNPNPDQSAVVSQIVVDEPRPGVGDDQPDDAGGDHGRRRRPGLPRPVVGQLADLQLQAARHRAGPAARPVLHRLDVHRDVGRRRARHGRGRRRDDRCPSGPRGVRRLHPRLDRGDDHPGDPREGRRER